MADEQQSKLKERDRQKSTPSNSSELVPYVEIDGEWTLPDLALVAFWKKLESQELIRTVFWEGFVTNVDEFVEFAKRPSVVLQFHFVDSNCIGMTWMTGLSNNFGFGHFCFFREAWGRHTEEAGKRTLDYWTGLGDGFIDTIIGIVPAFNERAHNFVRRIGLKDVGEIPKFFRNQEGGRQDAKIFYYQV